MVCRRTVKLKHLFFIQKRDLLGLVTLAALLSTSSSRGFADAEDSRAQVPPPQSAPARRMAFGDRTYPLGVTLERQVSARVQKYGACHVFAAVAAVHAACFRRTMEALPISEGYLFARHLRGEIENPKAESFLQIDFETLFSNNDAGHFSTTLERVRHGDVRLDHEYAMSDLDRNLRLAVAIREEFWNLRPKKLSIQRREYEERMRDRLRYDIDSEMAARFSSKPLEPAVMRCATHTLETRYVTLTPERAVRLINAAFPIICQFHDSPPSTSSHVYLLIGYRENGDFPGNLELLARDSRSPDVVRFGRELNCYQSAVVYGPEEQLRLDEALSI